jgi:hypothetical protein
MLDAKTQISEYKPESEMFCFVVKTTTKSVVLKAETEPEMHEWLNCIQKNKLLGDANVEKTVTFEGNAHGRLGVKFCRGE